MAPASTPVILMVAPNGARLGKADHPALPVTSDEIVATTKACASAGASALHLHVRDSLGGHTLDAGIYAQTLAQLALHLPGFPVQTTTESAGRFDPFEQIESVRLLRPRFLSVSIAEIFRGGEATVAALFATARHCGASLQIILYAPADVGLLASLMASGTLAVADVRHLLLVVGRHDPETRAGVGDLELLHAAVHKTPELGAATWMACAFGRQETDILTRAIDLGGHVRVGFENSIYRPDGSIARDNAERVAAIADRVEHCGRTVATPSEAAEILSSSNG